MFLTWLFWFGYMFTNRQTVYESYCLIIFLKKFQKKKIKIPFTPQLWFQKLLQDPFCKSHGQTPYPGLLGVAAGFSSAHSFLAVHTTFHHFLLFFVHRGLHNFQLNATSPKVSVIFVEQRLKTQNFNHEEVVAQDMAPLMTAIINARLAHLSAMPQTT